MPTQCETTLKITCVKNYNFFFVFSVNSTINPPKSIVLSRYTLHSTSLPRPQYAVPVNVMAPSNSNYYRNATLTTNSFNSTRPTTSPYMQNKLIDTKGAKHQANLNRRILTR